MSRTESKMVELGSHAPEFFLPEVRSKQKIGLYDVLGGKGLLVFFISNHCPYVQHIKKQITKISQDYLPQIRFCAISPNDMAAYPDDHPDYIAQMAGDESWMFPVLFDESQDVARSYQATCTPDFFLYDHRAVLVYRGQIDGSRPGNGSENNGKDLRQAFDNLIAGKPINPNQRPSLGCSIKWKPSI